MDEGENSIMYPLRGIKEGSNWILAAVTFDDIESLKTEFFFHAYEVYANFSVFGNSWGTGWGNERKVILEIIKIFKSEENAFDNWEREKRSRSK